MYLIQVDGPPNDSRTCMCLMQILKIRDAHVLSYCDGISSGVALSMCLWHVAAIVLCLWHDRESFKGVIVCFLWQEMEA